MSERIGKWHVVGGAIHVHTTESDGTLSLEEVTMLGSQTGLDYILFNDHMTLSNREQGKEGFYAGTLALVGYEHNDKADNNHFLVYDSPRVYPNEFSAAQYVAAALQDKAIGILAHPDEIRSREGKYPPYPWTDWSIANYTGLELWNQMSEWMERLTDWNKLALAFSPRKSMVGPTDRVLKLWDDVSVTRKCVGIAGVDAHAFPIKVGPFTVRIFPYKVHFRSLRTYLLLDAPLSTELATARQQVYGALADCRVYFANLKWGEPAGFIFRAYNDREEAWAGENLVHASGARLEIKLPHWADVRIIHNGRLAHHVTARRVDVPVAAPGLYRVECRRFGRGWIYSNHIAIAHPRTA